MHLLMDRAYEGDNTRQLPLELCFIPVVPPKQNRLTPWEYDRACTADAMKSSDCSVASKVFGASSPVSRNSM
jgi:hypothetical protein